jgi:hypothetical protein
VIAPRPWRATSTCKSPRQPIPEPSLIEHCAKLPTRARLDHRDRFHGGSGSVLWKPAREGLLWHFLTHFGGCPPDCGWADGYRAPDDSRAFPGPPPLRPNAPHATPPPHDNPGPEGQFRCFHHPRDMTKPPTRGNRARTVKQILIGDFPTPVLTDREQLAAALFRHLDASRQHPMRQLERIR